MMEPGASFGTSCEISYQLPYQRQEFRIIVEESPDASIRNYLKEFNDNPFAVVIYDAFFTKQQIERLIEHSPFKIKAWVALVSNEEVKTLASYQDLCIKILPFIDRKTTLICVGGGGLGDLCGFVASTCLRGIPWIFVPSTLLAQVDATLGGKNGLNVQNKNEIGTFYPPKFSFCFTDFLKTLSQQDWVCGYVELFKHALIADKELAKNLMSRVTCINNLKKIITKQVIFKSLLLKRQIIGDDFFEQTTSNRILLNLGHTFAHGFERLSNWEIPHGYAVAMGIVCAFNYAHLKGFVSLEEVSHIERHFKNLDIDINYQKFCIHDVLKVMQYDKKRTNQGIQIIVPHGVGACGIETLEPLLLEQIWS